MTAPTVLAISEPESLPVNRAQTPHVGHAARVAYQGERGAFSETAALALLGPDIELVPRPTFENLFSAIDDRLADYALAPIENALAGSVLRVYELLLASRLQIVGEVVIPIEHCLIGCAGATFEQVRVVESHPVALAQCERFFAAHPLIKREAGYDTAASVREVVERDNPMRAAIAGRRAALVYGGSILRADLQDHAENYTRFVLLAPTEDVDAARTPAALSAHDHHTPLASLVGRAADDRADKLSLVVKLAHRPGALYHALEPFARRNLDLLKIESRPVIGQPWHYCFYLDLHASMKNEETTSALAELRARADDVRLLGCYPSWRKH